MTEEKDSLNNLREISERDQENAKLREDIAQAVIQALPDAMIVVDEEGKIFLVNHEAELMFGRPRKELLNMPVELLLPERFRERHVQHRAKFMAEPRTRFMGSTGMKLFGLHRNGNEFPVAISLSPVLTERGMFTITLIRRDPRRDE